MVVYILKVTGPNYSHQQQKHPVLKLAAVCVFFNISQFVFKEL